ncbi:hypothetical protein [Amycolatopsis azurea]|nr:hypothetical protein [Amycolatopsis azurea]
MAMLPTGCGLVPTGDRGKSSTPAAQKSEMTSAGPVVDAVKAALPEFLQVEIGTNQDGLTTEVMVDAEVPFGYVVTGEKLKALLVSVWNSSDPKPAFVKFNPWSTYAGQRGAIKAQRAAKELGIDWSPSFEVGVNVPDYEIKELAGN